MLEVAIASVEAVFDWEEYLRKNKTSRKRRKTSEISDNVSDRENRKADKSENVSDMKIRREEETSERDLDDVNKPKKKTGKKSRAEVREELRQRELDNKKRAEQEPVFFVNRWKKRLNLNA